MAEYPPFAFPASSACFVSPERHAAEVMLGFEPRSLRQFWASKDRKGEDAEQRFEVPPGSDEFAHVETIFQAEPAVDSFYNPPPGGVVMEHKDVVRIERIENGAQHENLDVGYGTQKRNLERVGVDLQGGVHTRWLFHGTPDPEVLQSIVDDPRAGFNGSLNQRGLWGGGNYFARDSAYPFMCPGCCDSCLDEEGNMMIFLCLVQTGIPCVGEEGLKNMPKIHDGLNPKLRYDSFVDCPSNPEIFVVAQASQIYPAYIIHFS
jgi:hypothetical protein